VRDRDDDLQEEGHGDEAEGDDHKYARIKQVHVGASPPPDFVSGFVMKPDTYMTMAPSRSPILGEG
jgi:hypothetical protein